MRRTRRRPCRAPLRTPKSSENGYAHSVCAVHFATCMHCVFAHSICICPICMRLIAMHFARVKIIPLLMSFCCCCVSCVAAKGTAGRRAAAEAWREDLFAELQQARTSLLHLHLFLLNSFIMHTREWLNYVCVLVSLYAGAFGCFMFI